MRLALLIFCLSCDRLKMSQNEYLYFVFLRYFKGEDCTVDFFSMRSVLRCIVFVRRRTIRNYRMIRGRGEIHVAR